jgi:hypothetical protein
MTIRNTNDLMNVLAAALDEKDLAALDSAEEACGQWVQSEGSLMTQRNLINAVRAAIEELI